MKLSNHIFLARIIVSVASVAALLKYPDYWFVSLAILFVAVVVGGVFEEIAASRGR
jgi:presenilin-like A22 family membrane protease